jgi:putative ABC transport system permease protein
MTTGRRPHRIAVWLVSRAIPEADREMILGDLEEEFVRRSRTSVTRAVAWYWWQLVLFWMNSAGAGRVATHDRTSRWEVRAMVSELGKAASRLLRDWRFSTSTTLVLGIGLGAALVAYSVGDRILLRPLPYHEPERVALIRADVGELRDHPGLAMAEVADLREITDQFAGVESATAESVLSLDQDGQLNPVLTARVTPGLFELLGVSPVLGRVFDETEGTRFWGGAILSHAFWLGQLGGDPAAVGKTLRVQGNEVPITGVMPAGFTLQLGKGANISSDVEIFLPLDIDPNRRDFWGYRTVVRLREAVSFASANASLAALASALPERWPEAYGAARLSFVAHPVSEDLLRDVRPAINVAVAGVILLLLVSLANGASLMLGRQRTRQANLAVRSALGAGRGRLLGVVLSEALIVSTAAGVFGVALAAWGVSALRSLSPPGVPRWGELAIDARFFGAAMILVLLATLATGLYPALKTSVSTAPILRGENLRDGAGANRVRQSLVGLQMAVAVVFIFAGTVLGRSALRLSHVDLGFDPTHALTLAVPTDPARVGSGEEEWTFRKQLRERIRSIPGVVEAGAVSHVPLLGYAPTDAFSPPTADTVNWGNHLANYFAVTPGYLESIRVQLRQGRMIEDRDLDEDRTVAVVDESLAAAVFPGESPVGRIFRPGWGLPDLEIVGVIRHPRVMDVRQAIRPQIYVPYTLFHWAPLSYVVRTAGEPTSLASAVHREVDELGSGRAVYGVRTLQSYVADATSSGRLTLTLILFQAALTAILAAFGLFTVIAYLAYQTRHDTAIRSALGATRSEILGHHMRGGMAIMIVALPVGLGLALLGSRLIRGMVFQVSATDGWSLAAAAVLTGAVGLLATYLPARSAAVADPMEALRSD